MRMTVHTQLLILVALFSRIAVGQLPNPTSPDEAWNLAFTRSQGWTGGDVAGHGNG